MPRREPITIEVGKYYEDRFGLVHMVLEQTSATTFESACYWGLNDHNLDGRVSNSTKKWTKRDLVAEVDVNNLSQRNKRAKYT